jgi:cytochrome c553
MSKRSFVSAAVVAVILSTCCAAGQSSAGQSNRKVIIPIQRVDPVDGQKMYVNYCAPCHGADARGNGPFASALTNQPSDLTLLAKTNHGKYPAGQVTSMVLHGSELSAHRSAHMPVWGPVFGTMSGIRSADATLRAVNLSHYLRSIQQ